MKFNEMLRYASGFLTISLLIISGGTRAWSDEKNCTDMNSTLGIISCLESRSLDAETVLKKLVSEYLVLSKNKDASFQSQVKSGQAKWEAMKNTNCKIQISSLTSGEEMGITEISCFLSENLKRVRELEEIISAEKLGHNKALNDAINNLFEIRDPNVSEERIKNKWGVSLINAEFTAAFNTVRKMKDVSQNKIRMKSLKLVDEGNGSICSGASAYVAELGYYAQKTKKLVKIFVLSVIDEQKKIKEIKTSVQEDLTKSPVCP